MNLYEIFYEVSILGVPTRARYPLYANRIDEAITKGRKSIRLKHNVKAVWIYDCKEKTVNTNEQQPRTG